MSTEAHGDRDEGGFIINLVLISDVSCCYSVAKSCLTPCDPHGLQHTRLPYPSLPSGVVSNSCLLSWWCYITISSSAAPFSFCLQSFLAAESFPMNQLFVSGGQSIGSFSFTISPSNEQSGLISFRIDWFDLLAIQGTLKSLPQHHSSKASILQHSAFCMVQHSTSVHDYWKNHSFDYLDICKKSGVSAF